MSENNNYPSFYESTEGRPQLNDEQIAESSKSFNDLFDNLMLKHMDKVKRIEYFKDRPEAKLFMQITVDGQIYSLSLEDKTLGQHNNDINWRDEELSSRCLNLQRIDGQYGREYWSYRLGADGIVRRWDGGDMKEKGLGLDRDLSSDKSIDELVKETEKRIADINNEIANARLEVDMGINNQPVSPDEIRGLIDFISVGIENS